MRLAEHSGSGRPYSLWRMSEAFVRTTVVRWVDDEPFPGLVKVELTDATGHRWTFIDKPPVSIPTAF
jgi:hypothetical protein